MRTRRLLAMALMPAMLAGVIVAGAISAPAVVNAQDGPIPGGVYVGTLVESEVSCSDGDLTLGEDFDMRLNAQGTAIVEITAHGVTFLGDVVGTIDFAVDIAIAADGAYQAAFDVNGLAFVETEGRFEGDTVTGTFRVTIDDTVECDGVFSAQGADPPPRTPVTLDAPIDLHSDGCGGGVASITVSDDGSSLLAVRVTGLSVDGEIISGFAEFYEGWMPIAADSSFDWVYFPADEPGLEIALSGTFVNGFAGLVTVTRSDCEPVGFHSPFVLPAGLLSAADAVALPATGAGPAVDRGRIGLVWPALAAAAVATFVLALALLRRRGA